MFIRKDEHSDFEYRGIKGQTGVNSNGTIKAITWYDENKEIIYTDYIELEFLHYDDFKSFYDYDMENPVHTTTVNPDDKESNKYEATEEGMYIAKVTRTRNNDKTFAFSADYRVTEFPRKPKFHKDTPNEEDVHVSDKEVDNAKLSFKLDVSETPYDKFRIEWKRYHRLNKGTQFEDFIVYK